MKKILAMLLVFLQIFAASVAAVTLTEEQKQDLYDLGILTGDETGDLRLDDTITRAEAVKMLCVAGNMTLTSWGQKSFPDVPDRHWAAQYIHTAKEKGIVVGDEKGNFNPESPVTNEEIVKMIVCLLGYSSMAEPFGGYPAGYNKAASQIGITKDLGLEPKTPATRENVAIMITNALDTPIMVQKGEGNDENSAAYVILDGKNGIPYATIRGARGQKWDTSREHIVEYLYAFAAQYPYKEGDTEKSFTLYPNVVYTSGLEETKDGTTYECPAFYDDAMAYEQVRDIVVKPADLFVGSKSYHVYYIMYNQEILVPYETVQVMGCKTVFDPSSYVITVEKGDTVLEILPNVIGMRKNRAEGYWVPLAACARFFGDRLYIPLKAVAQEFGMTVNVDLEKQELTIQ